MLSRATIIQTFDAEIGDPHVLRLDNDKIRWFNMAQRVLGVFRQRSAAVTWAAAATSISLPTDFHHVEGFVYATSERVAVPCHKVWGGALALDAPATTGGSATIRYHANWPKVTNSVSSALTEAGDDACMVYCSYRFFLSIANARSDFRKYAALLSAAGIQVDDLEALAETRRLDFESMCEELRFDEPAVF